MKKQSHCIAGSITSGCFSAVLGHPLDTIKVHQQTNPQLSKTSTLDVAKLLARGNVLRLFRGIGPPMANQIMMNSVMFTSFNRVKEAANQNAYLDANSSAMVAGLFSGFATACISTPMDWVKIQAQISLSKSENNNNKKKNTRFNSISSMLRSHMVKDGKFQPSFFTRTLFSGHVANLGREGVYTMVYLGLYDRICNNIKMSRGHDTTNEPLGMGTVVLISSCTGALAWICNYPFDTVKTVMQAGSKPISLRHAIQSIYSSGGWRGFLRGAGPSTVRAMIVTSSRMLAYEKTIQLLR